MALRDFLGRAVSTYGSIMQIPNLGASQAVAGKSQPVKPFVGNMQPTFSGSALGQKVAPNVTPTLANYGPTPTNQYNQPIGPVPNGSSGGSGGSGGQVLGGQTGGGGGNGDPGGVYEQSPGQPSIDYDAMIAPALQALDQATQAPQSEYTADVANIEANRAKAKGELQQNYATGQTEAARNRTRVTGQAESAIDEARRQFAEIQQGLQARYGGTTGSGAFVEGLAGRQALQNIGQQRQALTQAITTIDDRLEQVRSVTEMAQQDVDQQAEAQKAQAKAQLDNALNSIRIARGELLSRKVELAQNAMQFYQQQVAEVNARNAAFKQQLYRDQQAAEQKLLGAKDTATKQIKQFELVNINDNPYVFNPYTGATQPASSGPQGVGQLPGSAIYGGQEDDELGRLNAQAQ